MAKAESKTAEKTNGKAPGPNLPLFYTKPEPIDSKKHSKLGLKTNFGFNFTKEVNAVPVNLIEMPQICHFYPIAFSPDGSATPVAILGLRDKENLFLEKDGTWAKDTYIPAYIRRYPFIFSELPNSDQLTLCIDMNKDIVNEKAEQKLFDGEKPSELSNNALEFCKSYHGAAQQTIEFSQALAASGLLVEREARINVGDKTRVSFSGFKIIDEEKLSKLDDQTILEWRAKGWLPFVYAHLFSGAQWQRLSSRLNNIMEQDNKK